MEEEALRKAYDKSAVEYMESRSNGKTITGFQNRNIERPMMFNLVPKNLQGKSLLDIGCGPGIHIKEYAKRHAKCIGIDLSPEMIKIARAYCPSAEFNVGSIYKLQYKERFDIITSSFVLDHVSDLNKAIKNLKQALKKGGLLIFSIPHPIVYMFRDAKRGVFIPSSSYFNDKKINYNIANAGHKFPGFPRTLDTYFQAFLKEGFTLISFLENKPKKEWAKTNEMFVNIPHLAFFVWKKI